MLVYTTQFSKVVIASYILINFSLLRCHSAQTNCLKFDCVTIIPTELCQLYAKIEMTNEKFSRISQAL